MESTTIENVAALAARRTCVTCDPTERSSAYKLLVLDRCDAPFTLLTQLRSLLAPGGTLVLAVVIRSGPSSRTARRTARRGEVAAARGRFVGGRRGDRLWRKVLKPAGSRVTRLARTPYICEGDQRNAAYVLDDAVFVLSAASGAETGAESVEDGAGI